MRKRILGIGAKRVDGLEAEFDGTGLGAFQDRKSTRLNSSHVKISYAVFCLKKKRSPRTTTAPRQMSLVRGVFVYHYCAHLELHSFPTRRSSDLGRPSAIRKVRRRISRLAALPYAKANSRHWCEARRWP